MFAGYTNHILKNLIDALNYYKQAINLDNEKLDAWKGAFKLYLENDLSLFKDDFSITVVDHLLDYQKLTE